MRKLFKALIIMFIITFSMPAIARAESITKINHLIENAKMLDGQELVIEGEVIGEEMVRGDYSWININDSSNAIGIWLSAAEADKIKVYGDYKNFGDKVIITGVFYRACKEHGGEADFHARTLEIAEKGHPVDIPISIPKLITAAVLSVITVILFVVFQRRKSSSYIRNT